MEGNEEYYTVSAVARRAANDLGMYSPHLYFQFEEWVLDGVREANFDFAGNVERTMLDMNSLRIIDMPKDFIDWVEVGLPRGERVLLIGQSGDLIEINPKDDCGQELPNAARPPLDLQPTGTNLMPYIPFGRTVPYNVNLLGATASTDAGLPNRGFFKMIGKYPNFRMEFDSTVSGESQIYLKYISDGLSPCGKSFVHPYMFDYLRKYTHYRRTEHREDISLSVRTRNETSMIRSRNEAIQRLKGFSPQDLINSMRRGFKLTTKV